MKLFTSSQDAIQNTNIELSEQELSTITGGCCPSNGCGGPQDPGGYPGFGGGQFGGGNFGGGQFGGETFGFFVPLPRPCHPHHHCCRY